MQRLHKLERGLWNLKSGGKSCLACGKSVLYTLTRMHFRTPATSAIWATGFGWRDTLVARQMAAPATAMAVRVPTTPNSSALSAMCKHAAKTFLERPKSEPNRNMKSAGVFEGYWSIFASLSISLKHLPMHFVLVLLMAVISLNDLGTPPFLHVMRRQAAQMAARL